MLKNVDRRWVVWIVVGAVFGVAGGVLVARALVQTAATNRLNAYSGRLVNVASDIVSEVNATSIAVTENHLAECSDQDLAFMRDRVYNARFIRDIGRIHGDTLLCTTGVGRLQAPTSSGSPDVESRGAKVRVSVPLQISNDSRGFVVQRGGVSMVINTRLFDALDQPPMIFGAWIYAPEHGALVHAFGHSLPLAPTRITSGQIFTENHWLYRSVCPLRTMTCVLAGVPLREIRNRGKALVTLAGVVGCLLGTAIAFSVLMYLRRQRGIEAQLRRALRRHELRLEYQPIVDLVTRRPVGVEALARWTTPSGDCVPPERFVAVAEERGFIGELTRSVLRTALDEISDLLVDGSLRLSVNLSAQDLADGAFPEFLQAQLARAGLRAEVLGLEITERTTANHEMAIASIERLRRAGHPVSIDDFGTGYSSLSYLHDLAVDTIKIDRRFTRTIGTEAVTASVVPQIFSMAKQLELHVVVEGIETPEEAAYFAAAAPGTLGQGYFFARPMPASLLRDWLGRRAIDDRR